LPVFCSSFFSCYNSLFRKFKTLAASSKISRNWSHHKLFDEDELKKFRPGFEEASVLLFFSADLVSSAAALFFPACGDVMREDSERMMSGS